MILIGGISIVQIRNFCHVTIDDIKLNDVFSQ